MNLQTEQIKNKDIKDPYLQIPKWLDELLKNKIITNGSFRLYYHMYDLIRIAENYNQFDNNKRVYIKVSYERLGDLVGLSRRIIHESLKQLLELNLIEKERAFDDSNSYYLNKITSLEHNKPKIELNHKKETKIETKDKPTLMNEPTYKILSKIVNRNSNYFNHKLPTKEKGYKITKTLQYSLKYLKLLMNNEFLTKVTVDTDYENLYKIDKVFTSLQLEKLMKEVLNNWELLFKENYFPKDKSYLKNTSLNDFFYNPRTKKSWFLFCLTKPQEIKSININNIKDDIEPMYLNLYGSIFREDKMTPSERFNYYNNVKEITDYFEEYIDTYKEVLKYNIHFKTKFSNISSIINRHMKYLKSYDNLKAGHIKLDGKCWQDFVKNMIHEFNVNLDPSKDDVINFQKVYDRNIKSDKIKEDNKNNYSEDTFNPNEISEDDFLDECCDGDLF